MNIWNVAAGLFGLCLLAGSHGAFADTLRGNYPTCRNPLDVERAESAAQRQEWVAFRQMKCGLLAYRGTTVRVVRCDADLTPVELKNISGPVPLDESLPSSVCEVEATESDGSTGTYYAHYLDIKKPWPVTNSGAVVADKLLNFSLFCREANKIRKAREAASRGDETAWIMTDCNLLFAAEQPVHVIRCAADVTPEKMARFSRPVPRDETLPSETCEVEASNDYGSSGIYYTNFYSIQKAPYFNRIRKAPET